MQTHFFESSYKVAREVVSFLSLFHFFITCFARNSTAVTPSQCPNQSIENAPRDAPLKWQQRLLFFSTPARSCTRTYRWPRAPGSVAGPTALITAWEQPRCMLARRMWLACSDDSHREAVTYGWLKNLEMQAFQNAFVETNKNADHWSQKIRKFLTLFYSFIKKLNYF